MKIPLGLATVKPDAIDPCTLILKWPTTQLIVWQIDRFEGCFVTSVQDSVSAVNTTNRSLHLNVSFSPSVSLLSNSSILLITETLWTSYPSARC